MLKTMRLISVAAAAALALPALAGSWPPVAPRKAPKAAAVFVTAPAPRSIDGFEATAGEPGSRLVQPAYGLVGGKLVRVDTPPRTAIATASAAPSVAGFEYELRRPNKIDPSSDDVFNFNIGSLNARYVERRERRFPPSSGVALNVLLGSNPVEVLTKPRRTGSGAQLGLEVAGILGACSLEVLSESEAGYDCDGRRFNLPVSR